MIAAGLGRGPTHGRRLRTVLGMDQGDPELRLRQPALDRIAQTHLGLLAHEDALPGLRIGFPHDGVQALDQVVKALLRHRGSRGHCLRAESRHPSSRTDRGRLRR